ncbi:mechanosensitive ion channel family protein [Brucella oryzae]|uniref:mechanosensitive ion channel family protein n=1 Tax=Brucella oryzae TaxID=335286 RepID=UPI001B83EE12|nr:mechanosensitive ion channel domain-containing protein [Brucella oryzae]MBR7654714.1 mechanosensitive ion channel family protein [Brucella oryzae]
MTKIEKPARRLVWPALATILGVCASVFAETFADALSLTSARPLQMLAGSFAYFSAAWLGGRLVGTALERSRSRKRPVPKLLLELVTAALFLVAGVATFLLIVGQSWSSAIAGSGLLIAILGFALRSSLADVFSGIALGIEAPYRIGDWISIDDVTRGRVMEIGWRTTRLSTRDSTYVILPNSQIARQKLTNYSAPRQHYRAHVQVLLNHEISVADAKVLLSQAAADSNIIAESPRPDVRVAAYESDGIRYHVRFWVGSFADDIDCRDAVFTQIDKALRARNLPLPLTRLRLVRNGQSSSA